MAVGCREALIRAARRGAVNIVAKKNVLPSSSLECHVQAGNNNGNAETKGCMVNAWYSKVLAVTIDSLGPGSAFDRGHIVVAI